MRKRLVMFNVVHMHADNRIVLIARNYGYALDHIHMR